MTPQEHAELDKRVAELCGRYTDGQPGEVPHYSTDWNACMEAVDTVRHAKRFTTEQWDVFAALYDKRAEWFAFRSVVSGMAEAGPAAVCQALVEAWEGK